MHYLFVWMGLNIFHRVSSLSYAMLVPMNISWCIFIAGRLNQIASIQHASQIHNKNNQEIFQLSNQQNNIGATVKHGPKSSYTCDQILLKLDPLICTRKRIKGSNSNWTGEDRTSYKVLVFEHRITLSIDYSMALFTIGLKILPNPYNHE